MCNFTKYVESVYRLNEGLIRMDASNARPEGTVREPATRMETMKRFLESCGNPQKNIPAIHVTGTSGKGSVCAAITGILSKAGYRVGLHISPYLQSATEKIWIDGKYISAEFFAELVEWVMPHALPLRRPETPASIHGMASVAIALEAFRREKVDIMVFEAGCGGRFDLTSFIDTKVAVITNVGLDHIVSLGPTISDIAWHKAGIARKDAPLITGASGPALDVIAREARALAVPLITIPRAPNENVRHHNQLLATAAAHEISHFFNRRLTDDVISEGISSVKLPGRFEKITDTATVFLDGAHNFEKLTAATEFALLEPADGLKIAVIGLLGTKANETTIAPLAHKFDQIIATQPNVYGKQAYPAKETAEFFRGETRPPKVSPNPLEAVSMALDIAQGGTVLICGSFYLCGEIRNRWYPVKDVVLQQNSWPILR